MMNSGRKKPGDNSKSHGYSSHAHSPKKKIFGLDMDMNIISC